MSIAIITVIIILIIKTLTNSEKGVLKKKDIQISITLAEINLAYQCLILGIYYQKENKLVFDSIFFIASIAALVLTRNLEKMALKKIDKFYNNENL